VLGNRMGEQLVHGDLRITWRVQCCKATGRGCTKRRDNSAVAVRASWLTSQHPSLRLGNTIDYTLTLHNAFHLTGFVTCYLHLESCFLCQCWMHIDCVDEAS